jgi:hypothetical protein
MDTNTICHFHKVANCPCWNNDHTIEYQLGGTFTLTYGALTVEGFQTYNDAFLHYITLSTPVAPTQPVKRVEFQRVDREYNCYLDGEYVGSRRTRIEADQYLDRLVHDRLSGMAFVRGE